uniref:Uncharacterized protein n=1 Tax=Chelonoidis abingdonii TaxID=106734 RepID=A0A8C0J5B9_CHEAB
MLAREARPNFLGAELTARKKTLTDQLPVCRRASNAQAPFERERLDQCRNNSLPVGLEPRVGLGYVLANQVLQRGGKANDGKRWWSVLSSEHTTSNRNVHLGLRLRVVALTWTIDPITDEDNTKEKEFHYSKLKRKQDIDQRRKRRKIEWMTKMYYAGSLRVKTEDPTTAILIQRSAEGIVNAVEKGGTDNVMEWEVDELLEWTNALNFEEYISQWKEIATSNSSANYQGKWRQL